MHDHPYARYAWQDHDHRLHAGPTLDPGERPILIKVYYNRTLLPGRGATRPFMDAYTLSRILGQRGYEPGDVLEHTFTLWLPAAELAHVRRMLERVYEYLNFDERPNSQTERSLSVGDVIEIIAGPERAWWTVRDLGFETIPEPVCRAGHPRGVMERGEEPTEEERAADLASPS